MAAVVNERTPLIPAGQSDETVAVSATSTLNGAATPLKEPEHEEISKGHFVMLLIGLWTGVYLMSLDSTIVAVISSAIASSFENAEISSWLGTSYLLSVCAFTPLYGRLVVMVGRRASILFALSVFGIGTVSCGFAPNMLFLIAARAFAGVGGGGVAVVGSVIVSDHVPLAQRGLYQGFTNILFGLGGATGAPFGGIISDYFGWRNAFMVQIVPLVISVSLLAIYVTEPHAPVDPNAPSLRKKILSIDYAGCFFLLCTIGGVLIGCSLKTTLEVEWSDPRVWTLLLVSVVGLVLFYINEKYWASQPILPIWMLSQRTAACVALNNFLFAVLSFSILYNVPLFFTSVLLRSNTNAGLHFIPNTMMGSVGSLVAGAYMRKTGKYYKSTVITSFTAMLSTIWLACWTKNTPEWVLYCALPIGSIGFGFFITTTLLALIASVSREHIPLATGLSYLFRTSGQVIGVSLTGTITQSLLLSKLSTRITGDWVIGGVTYSSKYIVENIRHDQTFISTLPSKLKELATGAWMDSLRIIFIGQAVLAFLIFLTTLPIEEHDLPQTVAAVPKKVNSEEDENGA